MFYIARGMTKFQRIKHKNLAEKLKKRKQGELNLIIRYGAIMK